MITKKQLLTRAQLHLARNEDEPLTCYVCLAIETAAQRIVQDLEKRPWWQKLLRPTRRDKICQICQMSGELQNLVESITGISFKLADAERILPGFNTLEIPEGYSPRQFARHLLLKRLIKEH